MLHRAAQRIAAAVAWFAVVLVSLATSAGLVETLLTPDDAPYLLLTRDVGDHPLLATLFLVLPLAGYSWLFRRLQAWVRGWSAGVSAPSVADVGDRMARLAVFVPYVYARWYRIALLLLVVWLPVFALQFPGQPSPDANNMLTEFLRHRSDFAHMTPTSDADHTAPYEDYPTSYYLLPDGDSLWSDHHPFYLMLLYGSAAKVSIVLFGSLVPGLMAISAASALFTLFAMGRALQLLGELVESWRHRAIALAVVAGTPLIASWSMAQHKNQLFSAAFCWWLALMVRMLHARGALSRAWYAEALVASLVIAISVQFGWIVLVAQALMLMLVRGRRWAVVVTMAVPALAVHGSIAALVAAGAVIPSDPIETKGLQLETLALILKEHPDTLTASEHAELSRIFDVDAMVASFDPTTTDPLKSTLALDKKTGSYRYRTVTATDWKPFNRIWLSAAQRQPGTFLDGLFMKSYTYLDPLARESNWFPPWSPKYERHIGEYRAAPMAFNSGPRHAVSRLAYGCDEHLPCRLLSSPALKTVVIVLLLSAAIAVRRRYAWFVALPFALQLGIAGVSPLNGGGRYVLGFVYALGLVLLLLWIRDPDPDPAPDRDPDAPVDRPRRGTPIGSPGSS